MHLQIVEADRQLARRYVVRGPHCWAMWIGLTESRGAGGACPGLKPNAVSRVCSPIVRPIGRYASTNRRSRQATCPAVCGKRATLLGNVDRADRKPRYGAELTKRQDVKPPGIRGWGE